MNKSGLIKALSKETNLTKRKAKEIVNIIFNAMSQAIINGERIEIRGFGNFTVKTYGPFMGKNPETGEKIRVSPRKLPFFKVGKDLREKIDY